MRQKLVAEAAEWFAALVQEAASKLIIMGCEPLSLFEPARSNLEGFRVVRTRHDRCRGPFKLRKPACCQDSDGHAGQEALRHLSIHCPEVPDLYVGLPGLPHPDLLGLLVQGLCLAVHHFLILIQLFQRRGLDAGKAAVEGRFCSPRVEHFPFVAGRPVW